MICDAHVHFFSPQFFETLARQKGLLSAEALARLGWDDPKSISALADAWVAELDRHGVSRAALIGSVPGDEESVADAIARHPTRFVSFFMLDPTADDAVERTRRALDGGMRGICLFPAMQRYSLHDDRVAAIFDLASSYKAAATPPGPAPRSGGPAIFVHCGVLSVGVRKKLGLPSPFDLRFGNPLDLHGIAIRFDRVPIIVPHFGAGLFREALMLADLCPNVYFDTSSSNAWMRYIPGLTLEHVFAAALAIVGPERLLFGSDSSFFPRGWVRSVYDDQLRAVAEARVPPDARMKIFGGNFNRLFPP
ncbi:MAG: amidohydrolase family protein [Acidobacteria bacterium]|nr:amidohydrolase family protein [Acidobacteriota bacterium]